MKNLDGRTAFGIALKENNVMKKKSWRDYFDVAADFEDDELLLRFKETFKNDFYDDGNEIKYYFYVRIYDGRESEVGNYIYLYLIPEFKNINKTVYEDFLDEDSIKQLTEEEIETEIVQNALVPILYQEKLDIKFDKTWYTRPMICYLETLTAVIPSIDRLLGFYMDKSINMIGTTNWDILEHLLTGKDWTKNAIDRLCNNNNNTKIN